MGFLSDLGDTLFGDEGKGAQEAQSSENEANREFIRQSTELARADINRLFPSAQQDRLAGFQGAQDIFASSVPQQFGAFQQGNLQAQGTTAAAPQQIQNALLGLPVDFGFLQAQQAATPDFGFLNQPLQQTQIQPLSQQRATDQAQLASQLQGLQGITTNEDLFRTASQGGIPNISAADQGFFAEHLSNIQGTPGAANTRFVDDPLGRIGLEASGQAGGFNLENERKLANLLTQFSNLQGQV